MTDDPTDPDSPAGADDRTASGARLKHAGRLLLIALLVIVIGFVSYRGVKTLTRPHDYDPAALDALANIINSSVPYGRDISDCLGLPPPAVVDTDRNRVIVTVAPNPMIDDFLHNDFSRLTYAPERAEKEALAARYHFEQGMIVWENPPPRRKDRVLISTGEGSPPMCSQQSVPEPQR